MQSKNQIGFIAQEMEKVFPELVKLDSNGLRSVNYVALIPVLVEALKEQNAKIETLEAKIVKLEGKKANVRKEADQTITLETITGAYLYQNTPNPFNKETQIKYYVPETVQNAFITVNDLNGKQIQSINITVKGDGFITIQAASLTAGMYVYALIADGNIIDTKRMVIVE